MPTIAQLKDDLNSSQSLGDIVDILKTTAMFQFRLFQTKTGGPVPDFEGIADRIYNLLIAREIRHPLVFERKSLPSLIVVVTTDEGFLGDLNTLLVSAGVKLIQSPDDELLVLGERGLRYLQGMDVKSKPFPGISDKVEFLEVVHLRDQVLASYQKQFGRVNVVYPAFVSLAVQRVTKMQLLPYSSPTALPRPEGFFFEEMMVEPGLVPVLESLAELWLGFKFLDIFWQSKQSEYAARIMHLEGSSRELNELQNKLSFDYFRMVHALKDKSIREISASKMILKRD